MSRNVFKMLGNFLTNADIRMGYLCKLGWYHRTDDATFLRKKAKIVMGKDLDLENPKTVCEKMNWLKIHDRNPRYTTLVDKYRVKELVADKIGKEHVIPVIGMWTNVDDIDIEKLPEQFVLKCNHDSGSIVVCKNKQEFNWKKARKHLKQSLKLNYYALSREWPYKDVQKCIIAEPYIDSLGKKDSIEYKVTCCNGKVECVTICQGIAHSSFDVRTNDHYTTDFEHMDWYVNYKPAKVAPAKPEHWDQIIRFSEILAEGIPHLRVDFYVINGVLTFGECTFYSWGGFMNFCPPECDAEFGKYIQLPNNVE